MNSESNIPYFYVNEECLKALNKVIKSAKKIESESYAEVIDSRSKLKGKDEYIIKIEHDLNNLWMLNQSNLFEQYQKIIEENAILIKDKNILVYKFEDIQLRFDKLQNTYLTEVEEKNWVTDELKML